MTCHRRVAESEQRHRNVVDYCRKSDPDYPAAERRQSLIRHLCISPTRGVSMSLFTSSFE